MTKFCPIVNRTVVYLDCLECEDKQCKNGLMHEEKNGEKHKSKIKKGNRKGTMKKPSFYEFVKTIYGLSYEQYEALNKLQKQAAEIDYINRYGNIKRF